jgi:hypothetical protein
MHFNALARITAFWSLLLLLLLLLHSLPHVTSTALPEDAPQCVYKLSTSSQKAASFCVIKMKRALLAS